MIDTSDAYKQAINAQVEDVTASITIGARDSANDKPKTLTAVGDQYPVSKVSQVAEPSYLIDGFGVLESGRFALDGSFFAYNENDLYGTRCWWGKEQPAGNAYSAGQGVRLSLSTAVAMKYGICINFDALTGEYATSVRIRVLNSSTLISDTVFDNSSGSGYFDLKADAVTRIEVIPLAWSVPGHRAKIADIYFGAALDFDGSKVIAIDMSEDIAPFGSSFMSSQMQVTIEDIDGLFAPDKAGSKYSLLAQDSLVSASLFVKLADATRHPVSLGTFSIRTSEHDADAGTLKLVARSLVDAYKGAYRQDDAITIDTAGNVASRIMAMLGVETFFISPSMASQDVLDYTDECDAKNLMQELAQACCHYIRADRSGLIEFLPISLPDTTTTISDSIGNDRLTSVPKLTAQKEGAYSIVSYKKYTLRPDTEVVIDTSLEDAVGPGSSQSIWISHDLAVVSSVSTPTPGCTVELTSPGLSSTLVTVASISGTADAPSIVIHGRLYDVETIKVSAVKPETMTGVAVEVSNRFIASKAQALALSKLYDRWLAMRLTASFDWRGDPAIETGDIIGIASSYGNPRMLVTSTQITYDGALEARMEGRTNV